MSTLTKQDVINLLPWYHLGKLTSDENLLVEQALAEDIFLQQASQQEQQIIQALQADKTLLDETIFEPTESRLNNVLRKIEQLEQVVSETKPKKAILEKKVSLLVQLKAYLNNLLSGDSQSFTYSVFAALTVVQLALLVLFLLPSDNIGSTDRSEYNLASHDGSTTPIDARQAAEPNGQTDQTILLISMESHFNEQGFDEILGDVKFEILPDNYGYYRVRLNKKMTDSEIQELKNELSKKHGKIWFMGPEAPR